MPRIRTVKPEFWHDEDIASLPFETRMLAIALLNYSDDEGWFNANSSLVKAFAFPFDELSTTIPEMLNQLCAIGYIEVRKCAKDRAYGRVRNFLEHQRVDRPKPSKIAGLFDAQMNRGQVDDEPAQEGKGTGKGTGKGKEHDNTANAQLDAWFEQFWGKYPRKVDKQRALKAFFKINPDQDLFNVIFGGLEYQLKWRENKPEHQFVAEWKHPTTWLNGGNWTDNLGEYEPAPNQPLSGTQNLLNQARNYTGRQVQ